MSTLLTVLTIATALGSGLAAGFFLAFSACVMKALAQLPAAQAVAAMQRINVVVINPFIMLTLFGTGLASAALLIVAIADWDSSYGPYLVAAAAVYLVTSVVVTMTANVPRNDALERLDPASAQAADSWPTYLREWTAWNHVRTVGPLVASGLAMAALVAA
ncbi:MAG TPA: anthrone oxygenase family protein [Baekduia sp.]|nr:anthrone oxygenase family protein [Baekduia sp.]